MLDASRTHDENFLTAEHYYIMIYECDNQRKHTTAIKIFSYILRQPLYLNHKTITIFTRLCFANNDVKSVVQLIDSMLHIGWKPDSILCTVLISGCTNLYAFDDAMVFYSYIRKYSVTVTTSLTTAVIKMLCKNNMVDQALEFFQEVKGTIHRDAKLYNVLISGCTTAARFDAAEQLHSSLLQDHVAISIELSTALIKMYCARGMIDTAMNIFSEIPSPSPITYTVMIAGCVAARQFDIADKLYAAVIRDNVEQDVELMNTVLKMYCESNRLEKALEIYYRSKKRTALTYMILASTCYVEKRLDMTDELYSALLRDGIQITPQLHTLLISMYCANNRLEKAVSLTNKIAGNKIDPIVYVVLITSCTATERFDIADQLYAKLIKDNIRITKQLYTAIIKMYCASNRLDNALKLFEGIEDRSALDDVVYNVLLLGCTTAARFDIADSIYADMVRNNINPSVELTNTVLQMYCKSGRIDNALSVFDSSNHTTVTYIVMLLGCIIARQFDTADKLVLRMTQEGISITSHLQTTLIKLYCARGMIDTAMNIFSEIPSPSPITYTVMIAGCVAAQKFDIADKLYAAVIRDNVEQDVELMNTVLKMYCESDRIDVALDMFDMMREKENLISDVTFVVLIAGCIRSQSYKAMDRIIHHIDQAKLTVSLTKTLIGAYFVRNKPEKAYELFNRHMRTVGTPDLDTFILLLTDVSSQSFSYSIESDIKSGRLVYPFNTCILILCYARRSQYQKAQELFDSIDDKDIQLWNCILMAYKLGGKGSNAVAILERMRESSVKPNSKSYLLAISACGHCGMISHAEAIIDELRTNHMLTDYHLACLVDAYARKGMLEQAECLAESLKSYQPTAWISILGGCKKFKDAKRAKRLVSKVRGKARQVSANILLANTYSTLGMLEERDAIRSWMDEREMKKVTGLSYVKIGNEFKSYVVEDRNAPSEAMIALDKIRLELENNYKYEPDLTCVTKNLQTVTEKIHHLWRHSEKIALGAALHYTEGDIEITKNLRICVDCHSAAKLISLLTKRRISIFDTYRGHLFENGECDCNDYY
jgi:pentatricopeptide repeat protein